MGHRATLALADVEPVAFAEHAAKDPRVKILGNDEVVDGDDKMIEGLCDGHVKSPMLACCRNSSGLQLFHKPVGDVSSTVESFLPVADAVEHGAVWRIDGVVVQIQRAARIHDAVVDAVTDQ